MRRLYRLGPCVVLLALAGCVPGSEPAFDGDPLLGGAKPLPRNGGVAAAPATKWNQGAPAPMPTPSSSASPAALAAPTPVADASPLRLPSAPPAALASGHQDAGAPWQPGPAPAGVTLQQPQGVADASVHPGPVAAPPNAGAPAAYNPGPPPPVVAPAMQDPYAQLQDQLTKRGVLFQSLQGPDDQGVWTFRCGVPAPGDPGSVRNIETSAAGDRGVTAIRAALDKIDHAGP